MSIIALILVFASNILTMAEDIKAVNSFQAAVQNNGSNSTLKDDMLDCDYIEYVFGLYFSFRVVRAGDETGVGEYMRRIRSRLINSAFHA